MRGRSTLLSSRDLRLLQGILQCLPTKPRPLQLLRPKPVLHSSGCALFSTSPSRRAKTKAVKTVKDLQQGVVQAEALPELETDDAPQYPAVVQGAKNNMMKFSNCVVLTRVGSFYELYLDHAEEYAHLLNLKLAYKATKAGPVAMAGFPYFQLDRFLKTLVQDLNKYVAISEEFPVNAAGKVKSGGLLFDRRVARVITPGTLIDEKFLDPYENNFLLAVQFRMMGGDSRETCPAGNKDDPTRMRDVEVGLAWLDLSTGDFFTQIISKSLLPSSLARIGAREIILDEAISEELKQEMQMLVGNDHHLVTFHKNASAFVSMSEWNHRLETPVDREAESTFTEEEKLAGHRLLDYVRIRLQGQEMTLRPPRRRELREILSIDRSSMRGLEILETARDGLGKGSLLHAVRRTSTKSGARLLRDRLTSPSASLREINERLDIVSTFHNDPALREELIESLRKSYDVQRLVQKFTMNKGDADDMICLARAIDATAAVRTLLQTRLDTASTDASADSTVSGASQPSLLALLHRVDLSGPAELGQRIADAIDEDGLSQKHRLEEDEASSVAALAHEVILESANPDELEALPKKVRTSTKGTDAKDQDAEIDDPWIMRRSASETIGRLHEKLDDLRREKAELAQNMRDKLAAPSLILKWTPGLGHIAHVKSGNGALRASVQDLHGRIVGSTKSTMSFYYTDWTRLGGRIDQARLHIRNEEQRIFADLRQQVIRNLIKLRRNAAVMDELDVACSFAILAEEQSLVRPLLNMGTTHKIIGGRHPTVKLGLEESGRSFVSNDLILGEGERIWLVTGPNMAGKSTFLRQNALISILAQVGSYVPADHAEIGLVDQIFSRIGAADDLFRDQSTFMVEMLETAAILKQATPRSFVIMDEVGRGTTPEDGTAVGYACLHHLYHVNKCRTLFATHFHALADMTSDFQQLGRYCTDVLEDNTGSFSFVHRLRAGVNRQSHALKVARLAGLPEPALDVAKVVLQQLLEDRNNIHANVAHHRQGEAPLAAAG